MIDIIIDLFKSFLPIIAVVAFIFGLFKDAAKKQVKSIESRMEQLLSEAEAEAEPDLDGAPHPTHPNEAFGMLHDNTRDHRIFEQEQREALHSEAQPIRLSEQKKKMKRKPLERGILLETPILDIKIKQTDSNKTVISPKDIRNALVYGEILGTPVSKAQKR